MSTLRNKIINLIEKGDTDDEAIMTVATSKGYTQNEVYTALTLVQKDRRIKTTTRGDAVIYTYQDQKPTQTVGSHITWLNEHYPRPTEFVMPWPEIDMSAMFLRTHEERLAYKAAATGRPIHMLHGDRRE